MNIKKSFLYLSKSLGLFQIARLLTGNRLRILCYHGFAIRNEYLFRPKLFIKPHTFHRRLRFLADNAFPVLKLKKALDLLQQGNLPPGATVITIDDGFYSTYSQAVGLLDKYSFPVTVYITSYYCQKETPIFRLAVQYMFWKTAKKEVDLTKLNPRFTGNISLREPESAEHTAWQIIHYGEKECDEPGRQQLANKLAELLEIDYQQLVADRSLNLMNLQEISELAASGIDIQLHTHRHCFPTEDIGAAKEIFDNKAVLEPVTGKTMEHFCYPSGLWSKQQWPWLNSAGIMSAMTCQAGLNDQNTPALALRRFLDGENISQIEFEAEIFGYSELMRSIRNVVCRLRKFRPFSFSDIPRF